MSKENYTVGKLVGKVSYNVQKYAKKELSLVPPVDCNLEVGDFVTYENEYGVSFPNMVVIGFSQPTKWGKFVHFAGQKHDGAYWYAEKPESFKKVVK